MAVISVIVPVYNTEHYLKRCVDSILDQTFVDFELILVDDGSTDSSGLICDGYTIRDSRIHVIHQKNGGLSSARNAGLDWCFANGNSGWISFVDSDDWIHPQYLDALIHAAQEKDVAVSICEFMRVKYEDLPEVKDLSIKEFDPEDYYVKKLVESTVSWGKLYRKECFESIRFPVGKIHEDEFVTYRILFQYSKIAVVEAPLYAYYQNDNAIMRRPWTVKRLDAVEALEEQICFFETEDKLDIAKFVYFRLKRLVNASRENIKKSKTITENDKTKWLSVLDEQETNLISKYEKYHWEVKSEDSLPIDGDCEPKESVTLSKSIKEKCKKEDDTLIENENINALTAEKNTIRKVILALKEHQFMFEELVKRDFKQKYKRTVLGMAWYNGTMN